MRGDPRMGAIVTLAFCGSVWAAVFSALLDTSSDSVSIGSPTLTSWTPGDTSTATHQTIQPFTACAGTNISIAWPVDSPTAPSGTVTIALFDGRESRPLLTKRFVSLPVADDSWDCAASFSARLRPGSQLEIVMVLDSGETAEASLTLVDCER